MTSHIKIIISTLIFSAIAAWLYRLLFCPRRIEFAADDGRDALGNLVREMGR